MKRFSVNQCVQSIAITLAVIFVFISGECFADYAVTWYTIDGGGGVGAGGQYVLEGTIGQPDAAYSAGGQYVVSGGFWPGGPECLVNFRHFARFAEWWLQTGTGLPADLYDDGYNIVDWLDLSVFVDDWLYYCPYDWPLR